MGQFSVKIYGATGSVLNANQQILVPLTILPRLDVGSPEQGVVSDARQGATALPVGDQTVSEYVLSNTLHHQTLCLGCLWHPFGSVQELLQEGVSRERQIGDVSLPP